MVDATQTDGGGVSTWSTWSVDTGRLLVHVEIGIRVLYITHVWTLLLNTELIPSASTLRSNTVLTLEAPHSEVIVLRVTHARVVLALLTVSTHEESWRFC